MALHRRLTTDRDFAEAEERRFGVRVFQDDHIVHAGGVVIRFDDSTVALQSGVDDIGYYSRTACEFFELRRR